MTYSVLIFVQDSDLYLDRALESLFAMPPAGLEVIAVNAGSLDASELVLTEWAAREQRVRVINLARCSEAEALNSAALQARGRWLGFMHARTSFRPDAWQRLTTAVDERVEVVLTGNRLPTGPMSVQQAIATRPRGWNCWVTSAFLRAHGLTFNSAQLAGDLGFPMWAILKAAKIVGLSPLIDGNPAAPLELTADELLAAFAEFMRERPELAGPLAQAALHEFDALTPPAPGPARVQWEVNRLRARAEVMLLRNGLGPWGSRVAKAALRMLKEGSATGH